MRIARLATFPTMATVAPPPGGFRTVLVTPLPVSSRPQVQPAKVLASYTYFLHATIYTGCYYRKRVSIYIQ